MAINMRRPIILYRVTIGALGRWPLWYVGHLDENWVGFSVQGRLYYQSLISKLYPLRQRQFCVRFGFRTAPSNMVWLLFSVQQVYFGMAHNAGYAKYYRAVTRLLCFQMGDFLFNRADDPTLYKIQDFLPLGLDLRFRAKQNFSLPVKFLCTQCFYIIKLVKLGWSVTAQTRCI